MEVPHGHGYQGVLLFDDINNKCQCHVCGRWFASVGQHAAIKHRIGRDDYKMRYGFTLKMALCSNYLSRIKSKNSRAAYKRGELAIDKLTCRNRMREKKGFRAPRQIGNDSAQKRNERGLCALQMRARYEVVKKIVGHDPSERDYIKYDKQLYYVGIMGQYGNLNNFRKNVLKEKPKHASYYTAYNNLELIASLRKVAKAKGSEPSIMDIKKHRYGDGPTSMTYLRHFGSWQQALCAAGIR